METQEQCRQFRVTLTVISRRKGKDLVYMCRDLPDIASLLSGWKKAQMGGNPTLYGAQTATGYNDQGELLCAFIRDIDSLE